MKFFTSRKGPISIEYEKTLADTISQKYENSNVMVHVLRHWREDEEFARQVRKIFVDFLWCKKSFIPDIYLSLSLSHSFLPAPLRQFLIPISLYFPPHFFVSLLSFSHCLVYILHLFCLKSVVELQHSWTKDFQGKPTNKVQALCVLCSNYCEAGRLKNLFMTLFNKLNIYLFIHFIWFIY